MKLPLWESQNQATHFLKERTLWNRWRSNMGTPIHMLFLTLSKLSYFAESQISLTKKIRNLPIKMLYIFSKPIAFKMCKYSKHVLRWFRSFCEMLPIKKHAIPVFLHVHVRRFKGWKYPETNIHNFYLKHSENRYKNILKFKGELALKAS